MAIENCFELKYDYCIGGRVHLSHRLKIDICNLGVPTNQRSLDSCH